MATKPLSIEKKREAVKAVNDANGVISAAAVALGIARATLDSRLQAAALDGLKPEPKKTITATSTLVDAEGNLVMQWIKADHKRTPDDWVEHIKAAFKDTDPVKKIAPPAGHLSRQLMTVYPIGDHHLAMYSWAEETGANYDVGISERLLTAAMQHLVDAAPPTESALIVNVGDFFHVDNLKNETSRSGNTLDVDTRYAAMIRTGVRMMRSVVEAALQKHKTVRVINAVGNHDDIGALWLSTTLSMYYEKNPRVTIDTNPSKFYYHRHGKVLIGVTHGDTGKPEKLHSVMAADRAEDWGATKHRYWLTGHVHTRRVQEFPGVMWETFRTLAPNDAWAHGAGYRSGRDMTNIVFHAEHGEIARNRFDVSMLEA